MVYGGANTELIPRYFYIMKFANLKTNPLQNQKSQHAHHQTDHAAMSIDRLPDLDRCEIKATFPQIKACRTQLGP